MSVKEIFLKKCSKNIFPTRKVVSNMQKKSVKKVKRPAKKAKKSSAKKSRR
jgi:hypothetical protein